ncbi:MULTISPECIES: acylphosphatase [Helicobacter]|uniref:acylphosphatase n=1 Tax=Helicobacter typhlonius TaxID=76936 RepID=A0A099UBT0_9HELI|nr:MULTISPECIES: acylphosphatase [Helicobacter]TLD78635.1 acylphosphatase [Helicobacter typhlonius]TLD89387.1 acylphosphatase [Helicobacter sp. MIT 03-1616]CUU40106.1 Acylphosphate phosphohydrolase, putative [Helicobacter typhlonius]
MKDCKEFVILGKVQGVGFRKFIKSRVNNINVEEERIVGHIRNMEDGSVRVVAQGDLQALGKLEDILWVGTIKSVVKNVKVTSLAEDENLIGFEILK